MAATLGRRGWCNRALFNVGKGTKKYFSVQIGRKLGVGRERVGFNSTFLYNSVRNRNQTFMYF